MKRVFSLVLILYFCSFSAFSQSAPDLSFEVDAFAKIVSLVPGENTTVLIQLHPKDSQYGRPILCPLHENYDTDIAKECHTILGDNYFYRVRDLQTPWRNQELFVISSVTAPCFIAASTIGTVPAAKVYEKVYRHLSLTSSERMFYNSFFHMVSRPEGGKLVYQSSSKVYKKPTLSPVSDIISYKSQENINARTKPPLSSQLPNEDIPKKSKLSSCLANTQLLNLLGYAKNAGGAWMARNKAIFNYYLLEFLFIMPSFTLVMEQCEQYMHYFENEYAQDQKEKGNPVLNVKSHFYFQLGSRKTIINDPSRIRVEFPIKEVEQYYKNARGNEDNWNISTDCNGCKIAKPRTAKPADINSPD